VRPFRRPRWPKNRPYKTGVSERMLQEYGSAVMVGQSYSLSTKEEVTYYG